jgi:heat-inducible transcriptional repressor
MLRNIIERQNRILEIIISSYVDTALPVGSRAVSNMVGLSSATIRNIMADLEEQGYIMHPHTSAGRVPTDRGYRLYVESLMRVKEINKKEERCIEEEYRLRRKSIEEIIKKSADLLAGITKQTGIVLFPKFHKSRFRHIDFVSVGKNRILVVLVTSTGIVRNFIIETKEELGGDLAAITNLLNSDCYGLTLDEIKQRLFVRLREERDSFYDIVGETAGIIDSMLQLFSEDELYLGGASRTLSQPEFEEAQNARDLMEIFEDKGALSRLLEEDLGEEGIKIYIGRENKHKRMRNCSLVTCGYRIKGDLTGRLGIIGPTRMDYDHLIPLVNFVSEKMTGALDALVE